MEKFYQMTEKEFQAKKLRLSVARDSLEQSLNDMKSAREFGDLREDSEYDAARDKYREVKKEIAQIENELENCEIVHDDKSPTIKIGSTVRVTRLDDSGAEVGKPRQFTIAQHGDTIIHKTIGAASPLGEAIIGKNSGVFDIICNGKKHYKVSKVIEK